MVWMRPLTEYDRRRRARFEQNIENLRARANAERHPKRKARLEKAVRGAERNYQWERTFPTGIWIYGAVLACWTMGGALLYRTADAHLAGWIWLVVYPIVVLAVWLKQRNAHRPP